MNLTPDETKLVARMMLGPDRPVFRGMFERLLYEADVTNRGAEGAQGERTRGRAMLLADFIDTFDRSIPANHPGAS